MKVKLTKEEFIKRSMKGEVFKHDGDIFYYDAKHINPFRWGDEDLKGLWVYFDGEREFTIVEPKPKTKIIKEFLYLNNTNMIETIWLSDNEVLKYFASSYYLFTGREFEVPDRENQQS